MDNDRTTGIKGWLGNRSVEKWLSEPKAFGALRNSEKRTIFVDDFSGHNESNSVQKCLNNIKTDHRKLAANETYMLKPADYFTIYKIKDA